MQHNNPGGLAQLARALPWHGRGHRFDSDILHTKAPFGAFLFGLAQRVPALLRAAMSPQQCGERYHGMVEVIGIPAVLRGQLCPGRIAWAGMSPQQCGGSYVPAVLRGNILHPKAPFVAFYA